MGWGPNGEDNGVGGWDATSDNEDWKKRDPNAPNSGPPQQTHSGVTSNPIATSGATISRDNFQWGGTAGGADQDIIGLRYANDIAQQRGAVQMDKQRADEELARSYAERTQQQVALSGYRQQLSGRGPSAAQYGGQAALEAALTQQAAAAGAGSNQNALSAAASGAGGAGSQAMGSAVGQYASARGQETAAAARGFGGVANAQRTQDLMSAGMSQEQALHQAQLEASQRARNDAMAQFYTTQEDDIRRQQLAADMGYEAQRDWNWENQYSRTKRQGDANSARTANDYEKGMGTLVSAFMMGSKAG